MLTLKKATRSDVKTILRFVQELAGHEGRVNAVTATEQDILRDGFGDRPRFECLVAEWNGEPAGVAIFFYHYSARAGRAGLSLENLYVSPAQRKRGIGTALLRAVAERAVREQLDGVVWQVLDSNPSAIEFYLSLGAETKSSRQTMRLSGAPLLALASSRA